VNWRDLLQKEDERVVAPYVGGHTLVIGARTWKLSKPLPRDWGWYEFNIDGRRAVKTERVDPSPDQLKWTENGYLIGDRFVGDGVRVEPNPADIVSKSERVFLLDPGLDRFARISVGRICESGPLIFSSLAFPLGPEADVLGAFLDQEPSLDNIQDISPALDAAFRMETWQRAEAERQRAEEAARRAEEERKRAEAERRAELREALGDGAKRREMAKVDFREAARAALAVSGAAYLDHRPSANRNEMVVRFRYINRRFECTCHNETLRIIDSGICLIDHANDDYKYDNYFTLESLPAVIKQADDLGKLVVFRHVY
jgi:hypothetical protein